MHGTWTSDSVVPHISVNYKDLHSNADIGSAEENVVQVSIGSDAVFTCQNNLSATIIWNVHDANGTRLNIQHNQDLTPDSGRDNNGVLIHSLTILALPKYNESMIQCTTIIDVSGNHQFINVSSVMTLIIEGKILCNRSD